jgi:hypothetical protein
MTDLLKNVSAPFLCAAAMGAVVAFANQWVRGDHVQALRLIIGVPLGMAVYAILIRACWVQGWQEMSELLWARKRSGVQSN